MNGKVVLTHVWNVLQYVIIVQVPAPGKTM